MRVWLDCANFVEWEEAKNDWANDATIRYGAETVARVPRMGAFTVIALHE